MKQSPEPVLSEREEFQRLIGASREALAKFDRYAGLLAEWNQKFNLVAASTLPHIWSRHFLDSAQLFRHIDADTHTLADLGSGAGFPGLVLNIMGVQHIQLIESIGKKASFLQAVINDLGLSADVHNDRIESLKDRKFDVLTARALKPLPELIALAEPLMKKDAKLLLLKGENIDTELTESAKYWTFAYEKIPSLSHAAGRVIIIRNIKPRHDAPRFKPRKSS